MMAEPKTFDCPVCGLRHRVTSKLARHHLRKYEKHLAELDLIESQRAYMLALVDLVKSGSKVKWWR